MSPIAIHHDEVRDPRAQGFSQGVRANGLVFLSGLVGSTAEDTEPRSFTEQARRAFASAELLLAQVGSTLGDVVATTIYVTDIGRKKELVAVRDEVFGDGPRPTSTLVEVSRLAPEHTCFELQVVAVDRGASAGPAAAVATVGDGG